MSRTYGFIKSQLKGNESEFNPTYLDAIFEKYDISDRLDSIRDQGSTPKCVSVALTDMVRYKMSLGNKYLNFHFNDGYFYLNRSDKNLDGMSPLEAFNILKDPGIIQGVLKFQSGYFAKIGSSEHAKRALIANGPVMICTEVKSNNNDFWNGYDYYGGHAFLITGYDSFGFKIRNSWGYSYGSQGYWTLPYSDFNKVLECWTLI